MTKKGFTLIELLAVIVILAIIALIAVPIVLGIIEDARKSATLRSAEHYLNGVDQAVAREMLNGNTTIDPNKEYPITKDGDICLANYNSSDKTCPKENTLYVEVDGQKPTDGTITLSSGSITEATLKLNSKDIEMKEGKLVYKESTGGENNNQETLIGKAVSFDPGVNLISEDGCPAASFYPTSWHIIGETDTTVDLLMDTNLWMANTWDSVDDGFFTGSTFTSIFNNSACVSGFTNLEPIQNFTYVNNAGGTAKEYGYQKFEIKNGVGTVTTKSGGTKVLEGTLYTRFATLEELLNAASIENPNLKEENLEAYLLRNLDTLKGYMVPELPDEARAEVEAIDTVDEFLDFMGENSDGVLTSNKHHSLYNLVSQCVKMNIEPDYDLSLPDWITANLGETDSALGYDPNYITLTTHDNDEVFAIAEEGSNIGFYTFDLYTTWSGDALSVTKTAGLRFVVTASKDKITILD